MNKIPIVCTCGGTFVRDPWRVGFVVEVNQRSPVGVGSRILRDADGQRSGVELTCGRCPRAPQFTWENWQRLVAAYDAQRLPVMEISVIERVLSGLR